MKFFYNLCPIVDDHREFIVLITLGLSGLDRSECLFGDNSSSGSIEPDRLDSWFASSKSNRLMLSEFNNICLLL